MENAIKYTFLEGDRMGWVEIGWDGMGWDGMQRSLPASHWHKRDNTYLG